MQNGQLLGRLATIAEGTAPDQAASAADQAAAAEATSEFEATDSATVAQNDASGDAIAEDDDLFGADDQEWFDPRPSTKQKVKANAKAVGGAMLFAVMAVAGLALAMRRRVLPTPSRLATMLVLAGAQTSAARNLQSRHMPIFFTQNGNLNPVALGGSHLNIIAAVSGIAGGALLASGNIFPSKITNYPTDDAMPAWATDGLIKLSLSDEDVAKLPNARNLPDDMMVDCGATAHMVTRVSMLTRITQLNPSRAVRVANGAVLPAEAIGEMDVPVKGVIRFKTNKTRWIMTMMTLSGVLAVPGLKQPLFSCWAGFEQDGIMTHLNGERNLSLPSGVQVPFTANTGKKYMIARSRHVARGDGGQEQAEAMSALHGSNVGGRKSSQPIPQARSQSGINTNASQMSDDIHASLGHFSADRIAMARELQKGIGISSVRSALMHSNDCPACALGGATKPGHSKKYTPSRGTGAFGDRVSVDVCGPFPTAVHTGFRYVIGFADRETKMTACYFSKDKTAESVKDAIKTFIADHVHLMPSGRIKELHTDNGGEFVSSSVDEMLNELMIRRSLSVPFTPQRNGQVERFFYTLVRHTRIVIAASGHSEVLWPFAMSHVVSIHNRLPTRSLADPMAPLQKASGKPPNLNIFKDRVWGCDAVVRQRDEDIENKLSLTGVPSVFLGCDERRHGEFHLIPSLNKVVSVVKAYKYYPRSFSPVALAPSPRVVINEPRDVPPVNLIGNFQSAVAVPTNFNQQLPVVTAIPMPNRAPTDTSNVAMEVLGVRKGSTVFSSSLIGDAYAVELTAAATNAPAPPDKHTDIYGRPDEAEWLQAELIDLKAKMKNGAFKVVDKASIGYGKRIVKSKYAYANKLDPVTNHLTERRARLVGCGYSQIPGTDFDETTCGTMRGTSVRALFSTAAMDDCDLYLGDVIKAFTQAKMDKEVYVEIPAQFNMPDKCFKALMSLEGLKQSAHLFQNDVYSQLRKQGAKPSEIDPNIWFLGEGKERITLGMWVDDILILTPKGRRDLAEKFWSDFRVRFNCKDLVVPSKFVGLEIARNRAKRTITITQSTYVDTMFDKFMSGDLTKMRKLPVGRDEALLSAFMLIQPASDDAIAAEMHAKGYMSIVGSLLFASAMTRPDIAFYVSFLAKMMHKPSPEALDAARGILGYLKNTRELGVTYGPDEKLEMHCDSSFGREPRPMAGFVVSYGGAALSWTSKALKLVPLSSAEAEANVLSLGCKDAVYVHRLLCELRPGKIDGCVQCYSDNQAAIDIIKAHGLTARTKHFERWAAYVRDLYQRHIIAVSFKPTTAMPADIFTKALPEEAFKLFRSFLLG